MNRPLRRLAVACLLLFAALLANANWVQVAQSKRLGKEETNKRPLFQRFARDRGDIRLADGGVIASSEREPDGRTYRRVYPTADPSEYAAVTGWAGVSSTTGLERAEDSLLTGTDDRLAVRNFVDTLTGRQQVGGYVVTTLNAGAQDAAWQGLRAAGKKGAVVALDVKTGAVLALVSSPSFDPRPLASRDPTVVQQAYDALIARRDGPLLDRATQATYPPGSFFKVVTSAAALTDGRTPDTLVASPQRLPLPQTDGTQPLKNFGDENCGGNPITLRQALTISCNTAFAQLGLDLGGPRLRRQAADFGVGQKPDGFPLPVNPSSFPEKLNEPQTAQSAIGQYNVALSPLQVAMVVQAIAAGGTQLAPYLVASEHSADGTALLTTQPRQLAQPVTGPVAAQLRDMMRAVVEKGTAAPSAGRLQGLTAGGKTGTAEHGDGRPPHAWFGGYAPAEDPRVAVAVIVEDGGNAGGDATGGSTAAPLAFAVLRAAVCGRVAPGEPKPPGC